MPRAVYDISVPDLYEVERALGDMKSKAPRAMKNAINQTATRSRSMMLRKARLRYALSTAGRRHINQLKLKNRATESNLSAELFISSRAADLADFKTNPNEPHMGMEWVLSPEYHKAKVLKSSPMKKLTGGSTDEGQASKGFLVRFDSGHVAMVQRLINKPTKATPKPTRWKNKNGIVERLRVMPTPSASAMHSVTWREEVEPLSAEILQERLQHEVDKILSKRKG